MLPRPRCESGVKVGVRARRTATTLLGSDRIVLLKQILNSRRVVTIIC